MENIAFSQIIGFLDCKMKGKLIQNLDFDGGLSGLIPPIEIGFSLHRNHSRSCRNTCNDALGIDRSDGGIA